MAQLSIVAVIFQPGATWLTTHDNKLNLKKYLEAYITLNVSISPASTCFLAKTAPLLALVLLE